MFCIFISPPRNDSFREDLSFAGMYFFPRVISELRRPIGAKFCTMLGAAFSFITRSKILGEPPQKSFTLQKHAKFGPIFVDFKVRRRISLEGIKIFKVGELLVRQRFLPH